MIWKHLQPLYWTLRKDGEGYALSGWVPPTHIPEQDDPDGQRARGKRTPDQIADGWLDGPEGRGQGPPRAQAKQDDLNSKYI